jgi:hypothetical protein
VEEAFWSLVLAKDSAGLWPRPVSMREPTCSYVRGASRSWKKRAAPSERAQRSIRSWVLKWLMCPIRTPLRN